MKSRSFQATPFITRQMLSLLRSKSLGASFGFAFAGAAFTFGNLLLARELPAAAFGQLALAVAIYNVCICLAPWGIDQVLLRRRLEPGSRLFLRAFVPCSIVAVAAVGGIVAVYGFPVRAALLLGAAIFGGGLTIAAGMGLRSHGWMMLAIAVTNVGSWALLISGASGFIVSWTSVVPPMTILAVANLLFAAISWIAFIRHCGLNGEKDDAVPPGEALSLVVAVAAGALLVQVERFVIPQVLGFQALATFAVVASVAIFPFRLLRSGSGFALTPRLRAATDRPTRFRLLASEGKALAITFLIGTVLVLALAPFVASVFTDGRYQLERLLILAACFNGAAKLLEGLPHSAVVACGTAVEIRHLSWMSWFVIAATVAGSWLGARWGLAGLMCGSAAGCLIGSIPGALLARKVLVRGFVD
ncbi:hypothetical protein GCM10011494_30880 [Novosphingobium endophyticum]|uniref:Uncharacterized protein n=1 Tax=Novosphingobium endophyticum TaxID=1955250 RepID=A0A916X6M0_9SPHN|nr:hypothetical protein [Novosphingobium endophyticum]GGC10016.1 hypothetical protein GCM10011494_30880 [Novosphingobium endophyticum]